LIVEEKACIVGMYQSGAKGVEIVAALGHSKSIVSTILKEFQRRRSMKHPKLTGHPQKLSKSSVRVIAREVVQDQRKTLVDITNRSGVNVSTLTMRKALHDVGFYSHIAQKKPFLSDIHRARRLEFAREHQKWTIKDWNKVIWTNDSSFEFGKSSCQILLWRKSDECYK
jgi:transposase